MSTEANTPDVTELTAEVERLRKTNKELLEAKHTLKTKVAELEASNVTLQETAEGERTARYEATINVPLKRLAAKIAVLPELFLKEFGASFKLDIDDKTGALVLMTNDGKVVEGKDGKPLEANEQNLYTYLTGDKTNPERSKTFSHLLLYRGASGGGAGSLNRSDRMNQNQQQPKPAPAKQLEQFGLRSR